MVLKENEKIKEINFIIYPEQVTGKPVIAYVGEDGNKGSAISNKAAGNEQISLLFDGKGGFGVLYGAPTKKTRHI